eukprot:8015805-Alexandrium_andersonii.AAC.1
MLPEHSAWHVARAACHGCYLAAHPCSAAAGGRVRHGVAHRQRASPRIEHGCILEPTANAERNRGLGGQKEHTSNDR